MDNKCCVVCGAILENPDPYVLYHSEKTGRESYACPECARRLNQLLTEEDAESLKQSLEYLEQHTQKIRAMEDKDLLAVLAEIIEDAVDLVKRAAQETNQAAAD